MVSIFRKSDLKIKKLS